MDLGQRVSLHRGSVTAGGWSWYLAAVCVAAGVLGLARGVSGDAQQAETGLAALALGVALSIVPILRWRQQVEVLERGFVWTHLLRTVHADRSQIRGATFIRHTSRRGSYEEVQIELTNGKAYSIVGIQQADQLVNLLRAQSTASAPEMRVGSPITRSGRDWSPGAWKPPGG